MILKNIRGKGGFISAHWDGTAETEEAIKERPRPPFAVSH
jgi:hypothetical protein